MVINILKSMLKLSIFFSMRLSVNSHPPTNSSISYSNYQLGRAKTNKWFLRECEASQPCLTETDKWSVSLEYAIISHLKYKANFALLVSGHGRLWHRWDSSSQSPNHKVNAFQSHYSGATQPSSNRVVRWLDTFVICQHGGPAGSVGLSQLQGLVFNPELTLHVHIISQTHAGYHKIAPRCEWIGTGQAPDPLPLWKAFTADEGIDENFSQLVVAWTVS